MSVTVTNLLDVAKKDLLIDGGVDNWEWYGDSLEDYTESEDEYEDTASFLNALSIGGVDNWEWYGESLTGLSEYEDYLLGLDDLTTALNVYQWKTREAEALAAVETAIVVEAVPVVEKLVPKGDAEQRLHNLIVDRFGADDADDFFQRANDAGIWKSNTFPKEYKNALKVIKEGVKNPLEAARGALLDAVVKNGKLDDFLTKLSETPADGI